MEAALAMFLVGALGGGHCVAMCSALLTATRIASTPVLTAGYHLGRIGSYAMAGALAGGLGSMAFLAEDTHHGRCIVLPRDLCEAFLGQEQKARGPYWPTCLLPVAPQGFWAL